jgi:putative MATE family efflux protein
LKDLLTQPTRRPGIWELALPTITGNVIFALAAMIQTRFVGALGAQAVAAVGVSQRVLMTMQALFMAISIGLSALTARAWGANDRQEAARVLTAGMVLTAVVSGALTVAVLVFSGPIAGMFGLDPATTAEATENVRWVAVFVVGYATNIIVLAALRAASDVIRPLLFVFVTNGITVVLMYAFVFGRFGAPRMDSAGAPFALGIVAMIGAAVLVFLWWRQKLTIGCDASQWRDRDRYRRLIDIAYPAGLEQLCMQGGMLGFLAIIGHYYGKEAFAAYAIGTNLLNLAIVVGFGFSVAGSTLVGQYLGAGDFHTARRSGWRAMLFSVGSMSAIALVTVIFAEALARFFLGGGQELTVSYTMQFMYVMAAILPFMGVEFAIGGALRGAGDTRYPLVVTLVSMLGARIGLAIVAIQLNLPVVWVYGTMLVEYLARGWLLVQRFRSGKWKNAIAGRLGRDFA